MSGEPDRRVVAVYADGGLIKKNPSSYGATWATCHVDENDQRVWRASGMILPARWNGYQLENNQSEFFALLQGLKALPDGWRGYAYSDNQNTIRRFSDPYHATFNGIPKAWVQDMRDTWERLGSVRFTLLKGHPNKKNVEKSVKAGGVIEVDGKLVSHHNAWCDHECSRLATDWWKAYEAEQRQKRGLTV